MGKLITVDNYINFYNTSYICVVDADGNVLASTNTPAINKYRDCKVYAVSYDGTDDEATNTRCIWLML